MADRMPELDLSQSLLPPDYPDVTLRHVALLLATWMLARIAEVVHNLLQATQCSEAKGDAASLPVQQGEPTLKAGSSVPKQSNGYSGVHAWTSMEARNFKVRSAPRLQCYHQPPSRCDDGCAGCLPSLPLRMLSPLRLLSPPGALRPQLSQVWQEGAEQRGAWHGGGHGHIPDAATDQPLARPRAHRAAARDARLERDLPGVPRHHAGE